MAETVNNCVWSNKHLKLINAKVVSWKYHIEEWYHYQKSEIVFLKVSINSIFEELKKNHYINMYTICVITCNNNASDRILISTKVQGKG